MCRIIVLVVGFLAAMAVADAQQIKGVVSDSNGDPLVGVSVFVDGTTLGVSTDVDGAYTIDIPDARGKTLVFSCIGMATKEILIGQNTTVNITLEEDTNFLDETVVIGYATVKRRDLLGSVTSVGADAIAAVPVTTVSEALAGKMAYSGWFPCGEHFRHCSLGYPVNRCAQGCVLHSHLRFQRSERSRPHHYEVRGGRQDFRKL